MKFNKIYILFIGASILSTSCKDVLEAPSQSSLDEQVIYTTPVLAEGAYTGIVRCMGEVNFRARYIPYYGANTDTELASNLDGDNSKDNVNISNYNTKTSNSYFASSNGSSIWESPYTGIERANIAIAAIKKYNNLTTNKEMAHLLGEILTIRAVYYSDLIKAFGDIPARFEPLNSSTINVPRSDKDVIYKQLLADLKEAEEYLAWPNENAKTRSVERVSKAFAKALRARIALYAGGYSQRMDGTVRLSSDPDLSSDKMYQIAKDECLDIIQQKSNKLLGFEEVFRTLLKENTTAGLESMWEVPYSTSRGRVTINLGVAHTTQDQYYTASKNNVTLLANPTMLYEYEKEDVRKDVTLVPYSWENGKQILSTNYNKIYFGKFRAEWMTRPIGNGNDDGMNWIYMRYSDVLLMAAEAINELEGPTGPNDAQKYFRAVRERAYPNNPEKVNAYMDQITSGPDKFRTAIRHERALEFTGEMLRKADLIRWNLLSDRITTSSQKLEQLKNKQGIYADLPTNVYYKYKADGISLDYYGFNIGDTDSYGAANYTNSAKMTMNTDYWTFIAARNPDLQQYWPVPQFIINNSNGTLTNGGVSYEQ